MNSRDNDPDQVVTELVGAARDALYIGVGMGVIIFQKSQVQRREVQRQARRHLGGLLGRTE